MTVLVDPLVTYPGKPHGHNRWCHMGSDLSGEAGLVELHALAAVIGLRRDWFQDHPTFPHYDLVPSKRALAIKHGAVAVGWREFVKHMRPDLFEETASETQR